MNSVAHKIGDVMQAVHSYGSIQAGIVIAEVAIRLARLCWLPLAFYRIVFQLEHLLCIGFFGKVIYMIYRPVRQVTRSEGLTSMTASAVL